MKSAEPCRLLHEKNEFIEASQEVFSILSSFISELNSDIKLYALLMKIHHNKAITSQLSDEENIRFINEMKRDDKEGIHSFIYHLHSVK